MACDTIAKNYESELRKYPRVAQRKQPTRASALATVAHALATAIYSECYSDESTGLATIMFFRDNSAATAGVGPTGVWFSEREPSECRRRTQSVVARNGYVKTENRRILELLVSGKFYQPERDDVTARPA